MEYRTVEFKTDKCIVRVHRPILSAEEKKARVEEVKKAIVRFYKETRGTNV